MEFIKNFGIDPLLLAAQIVNFLIILFILKLYLYKPVLELLKKREDTIKEGLKKAEEAQKLLEETLKKEKEILKNARLEALKIIDDAKREEVLITENAEKQAFLKSEMIIKEGEERIQEEYKKIEGQLASKVSMIAASFLQKIAGELFSEKEQQDVMERAIKKLRAKSN